MHMYSKCTYSCEVAEHLSNYIFDPDAARAQRSFRQQETHHVQRCNFQQIGKK